MVPVCKCPTCHLTLDATTSADGRICEPRPGDVTICIGCTTPLIFNSDLLLEHVDIKSLESEVQDLIVATVAQIQTMRVLH